MTTVPRDPLRVPSPHVPARDAPSTMRKLVCLLPLVALCAACAGAGEAPEATGPPEDDDRRAVSLRGGPNLLLVTVDTIRADRVGSYGHAAAETPTLDRLSAGGVRFAEAVSTVPVTLPAHASILAGRYPHRHGVRNNGEYSLPESALTLTEILADAGYDTGAFLGAWVLDARFGLAQGFSHYTDFSRREARAAGRPLLDLQRRGDEVVDEALDWLAGRPGPFFAWAHLYDPHAPYAPPQPWAERHAGRPYDGEIAFTDAQIGRLVAHLEERGLQEDTLVVVVGDHGEGLGEHRESTHSFFVYRSTLRVPLLFWQPGALPAGTVVGGEVSLVDLLPTVLGLLEVADPRARDRDGIDLRPGIGEGEAPSRAVYAESLIPLLTFGWSELRAIHRDGWKYIEAPRPELYDLRRDPGETRDLAEAEPERARRLAAELEGLVGEDSVEEALAARGVVDAETMQRLRGLGYLSGGGTARDRDADPKDKIHIHEAFTEGFDAALAAYRQGRWQEAREELEILRDLAPAHYLVHHYLGRVAMGRGDPAAVAHLEESLALNPAYVPTIAELARAYRRAGRLDRGLELLRESVAAQPDSFELWLNLGYLRHVAGRPDAAMEAYARARELVPGHPRVLVNVAALHMAGGRAPEALEALTEAAEAAPDDPEVWKNLGTVRGVLGRFDEAAEAFGRALSLGEDDDPRLHFNLGLALFRAGRPGEAEAALREALRRDPSLQPAQDLLRRLEARGRD